MIGATPGVRGAPPPFGLHCWHAALDLTPAAQLACEAVLDGAERLRADRFVNTQFRQRWVAARGQLRWLLAAYTGLPAAALCFNQGGRGKPALAAPPGLHFNLSHSAHAMVVGIAGTALGVDLECMDGAAIPAGLAGVLAPAEQAYLEQGPAARFFECWTRKEACLKAAGCGIDRPLSQLDTSAPEVDGWQLHTLAGRGWVLSVAAQPGHRLSHHRLGWRADGSVDLIDLTSHLENFIYA